MKIGIGTYSLFWEFSERNPAPLSIAGMIDRASELGCDVFQICDDPRVEELDAHALRELGERAESLDVDLELGTRTIARSHLARYLDIAEALGARTLRSMIQTQEISAGPEAAVTELRATLPRLESSGISLALETYEQVATATLLRIVESLDTSSVGICLDPANCVSALEHPRDVVESCADRTVNLHVKDFAFARQDGWIGFTLSGAPLGEGLLDLDHELSAVYAQGRSPSAIVEHWLPWQEDLATTLAAERDWTDRTLSALRAWRAVHRPTAA
jgi:3-oxoisoapionate decarboxylase